MDIIKFNASINYYDSFNSWVIFLGNVQLQVDKYAF